ncbi:MAG: 16S rRNA (guanine(527)-N(7))-methyltransferase RsmG [Alphaproteobacteria bacterium]
MTPDAFQARTGVSRETLNCLRSYAQILERWNQSINLVAGSTLADPWRRHFLDSAQLVPLIPPAAKILVDFGSGAGFPGLIIAAMTELDVHLVERDSRKAVFLQEVMRVSGIKATLHRENVETLALPPADVVTARAFAPLVEICGLAHRFLRSEGIALLLKGRNVDEELTLARKKWKMQHKSVASQSDPSGVILVIGGLRPVERSGTKRSGTI